MMDPAQIEASQDEDETLRAIDGLLAGVYGEYVRAEEPLRGRLGRILDTALKCREMGEAGMWLDLLRSQWRDCRLSGVRRKR